LDFEFLLLIYILQIKCATQQKLHKVSTAGLIKIISKFIKRFPILSIALHTSANMQTFS